MWGVVYQGYNAVFPSFYPELFPTRIRVSAMAIAQNSARYGGVAAGAVRLGRAARLPRMSADRWRDHIRGHRHSRHRGQTARETYGCI